MSTRLQSAAAALFLRTHRTLLMLQGASSALFEGLWMGLLPESVYDSISEQSYGDGAEYSNDAYLDSGLQFWEELAIADFPAGASVLVGAAGGGREVIALRRAGFAADGFECSRPMVATGKKALAIRQISARFEWAPPCRVSENAGTYDAAIVGWNGYTYISPRARRIEFLRAIQTHLQPGAQIVISGAWGAGRQSEWTARIANAVRRCTGRAAVFGPGDAFPGRPRHSFTRPRVYRELESAGLLVVRLYKWGVFFAVVARAKQQQIQTER